MAKRHTRIKRAIRAALADQGRTQDWLARTARISGGHLSRILDGYVVPTEDVAARIERITGVNLLAVEAVVEVA